MTSCSIFLIYVYFADVLISNVLHKVECVLSVRRAFSPGWREGEGGGGGGTEGRALSESEGGAEVGLGG